MAVFNVPNYKSADGLGFPLNFRRGNPNPLDNSSVWASLDAAKTYAKTDATAYVGQILSVVDNDNGIVDVYKIQNAAGDLVMVGTVTLGDDKSIVKNDDDTLSLYDFGKRYYKYVAAEGEEGTEEYVAAHYEATDGWIDGLEPKVSGNVLAWYEPNPTTVEGLQATVTTLQESVATAQAGVDTNTAAIAVLNGDDTTEGSVAYQIAQVVAGAGEDFDTLKEIADWIAGHPDSVAEMNTAITANANAIDALEELVGEKAVATQITEAITAALQVDGVDKYALASDLSTAIGRIAANETDIDNLQALVGSTSVEAQINATLKETVEGVELDKYALRVHTHTISDVAELGATLDTKANNDSVNTLAGRVTALEDGLDTAIDAAINEHVEAADAKYATIESVTTLSGQVDAKVAALEGADATNLSAAKTYADEKIAALNINEYAKQADLDITNAAITAIKDHDTVDSFADVMAEIAKKQDIIPENTYDAYGSASAVDAKLESYKTSNDARVKALEDVDNATQAEMDVAVADLEAADKAINDKIGEMPTGEGAYVTLVEGIANAQSTADAAATAAEEAQADVDALAAKVGEVPEGSETVIAYINKKAQDVLDSATGGSSESAASVKLALDSYKAENDPKVTANTQGVANNKAAIEAEVTRATEAEAGLEGRIETMEAFWEAAQADGTDANVIDTLKEIQEYIASDESGASAMAASIKENTDAIAAEKTRAEEKEAELAAADETNLQAAKDYADDAIESLNMSQYAKQTDLDTAVGRIEVVEGKIPTIETNVGNNTTAIEGLNTSVGNLETIVGEHTTSIANLNTKVGTIETTVATLRSDLDARTIWGVFK